LGWFFNAAGNPDESQKLYTEIHKEAGGKPALMLVWPEDKNLGHSPCCDIVSPDSWCYIPSGYLEWTKPLGLRDPIELISNRTDRFVQAVNGKKPVWMNILSCEFDKVAATPKQVRSMVFLALNHGATGIFIFRDGPMDKDGKQVGLSEPRMAGQRTAAYRSAGEVRDMAPAILRGKVVNAVTMTNSVDCIDLAAFADDHKLYVVAVNILGKPARPEFGLPETLGGKTFSVLNEKRTISPAAGKFTDMFAGHETHVYVLDLGPNR
jgi:hypothetical protein